MAATWNPLDRGQFADYEVADLHAIFTTLAAGESEVRVDALAAALATCPVAERLLERAAASRDTLSPAEVLVALGPLGANSSALQKLRALFDAFDLDGDGVADINDCFSMLKLFLVDAFTEDALRALAKEIVGEDGLSFDAFTERFAVEDVLLGIQLGVLPLLPIPPQPLTLPVP
ncbi:hypothetical protein T492DRAFT_508823 [Pavlovales sp. CCMP2436]|nr:hypothetical protein T492DRAFT_508823 [Pavlovales sp. CCMP2436]|mmetsp:Transcript_13533/g.34527  ORF Transcript_13533/g.34527 Transcript_13533/m.34527 type:complete len:175 (+) Transcript_13533:75-599(+)|eukprot:CAMPEP_0179911162 /NCGR_PEP_ID=MMETSP0982-20121206/46184_1 /TAXON_ID=483367 /ORGANISM="non described non described, Strain CCMP 2436" /LENGTH=174 /DNA_ID=CAMNT_0021812825 /DNA_START=60 /DNA_END=584 /DNA_ORIENTATION=+